MHEIVSVACREIERGKVCALKPKERKKKVLVKN